MEGQISDCRAMRETECSGGDYSPLVFTKHENVKYACSQRGRMCSGYTKRACGCCPNCFNDAEA
eukprot:3398381-Pleurochrysis_carterae.AAC.1